MDGAREKIDMGRASGSGDDRNVFFHGHDFARCGISKFKAAHSRVQRILMAVEDQGSGTRYVPVSRTADDPYLLESLRSGYSAPLTGAAGLDAAWIMCTALSAGLMWLLLCTWQQAGCAMAAALRAIEPQRTEAD